jgi:hypothetical protein
MLSTFEVFIYACSFALLPLALYSLATGSKAPQNSWLTKYYAAERCLGPTGDVMLVVLCVGNIAKLAIHISHVAPISSDHLAALLSSPFMILVVAYWVLWIRALKKVRRMKDRETHA